MQNEPESLRAVTDARLLHVFFIRHRHHYVFFRKLSRNQIGVISVLHENMNLPSRLRENLPEC